MERDRGRKPKVGIFGCGHAAYWPQFPNMKPAIMKILREHEDRIAGFDCEIVDGGLVDTTEVGVNIGEMFARERVDIIICEILTYTPSAVWLPIAQRNEAPFLILALQHVPTVDYDRYSTEDFTFTGAPMNAPEFACACERVGLPFHCVFGGSFEDRTWKEVREWIEAAAVKRALRDSRIGFLGHYYPGMLDMYTDFTMHQGQLGIHVEILEMCDLQFRIGQVTQSELEAKLAEARETFEFPEPGYDPITEKVDPKDLEWAARVACGLDRLADDFKLDGLAYYYRGWNNNEYERIGSAMILGNSLLTARGIPCAGEGDLKTCMAMFILDRFGAGGSFCEIYFLDFPGRFIIAGHDGPGHIGICHKKPILRGMKLFHGKRGYGVSVEFNVKNGPITMLSITQTRDGRLKMISAQGESIPGPIFKIGNTNTRIRFGDMDVAEFGQAWAETGSSHHFALGIGHQLGKIEKLSKLLNLELVVINR
ncbi:MAG: arabinose isomerase [bacterium]